MRCQTAHIFGENFIALSHSRSGILLAVYWVSVVAQMISQVIGSLQDKKTMSLRSCLWGVPIVSLSIIQLYRPLHWPLTACYQFTPVSAFYSGYLLPLGCFFDSKVNASLAPLSGASAQPCWDAAGCIWCNLSGIKTPIPTICYPFN